MTRHTKPPSGYTVLVVDDQDETLRSTRRLLEREGHRVVLAAGGREALDAFRRERPQLLIIDYFMPGMTGEELIREIRRLDDGVQILLQTGYAGDKPALEMLDALDIQGYHDKSDGPDHLLVWVRVCLKAYRHLQRVREAERLKDELLANMSHELRTPLTISLGYFEMLMDGACGTLSPDARMMLERAERNTTALLGLVTDLLDLAKLETQAADPRLEPIPVADLRRETLDAVDRFAGGKNIELRWEVPHDCPPVRGDRSKIGLVLSQVILSAIGGMAGGEIGVQAWPRPPDAVALVVGAHVGRGRGAADGARGTQSERSGITTEAELTSLGLAMARRVAQSIGGNLTVERRPETGRTFAVTLPIVPAETERLPSPASAR